MNKNILPVLVLASLLPSCASIVSGTAQQIKVASTPTGADCVLLRKAEDISGEQQIGQVSPTPGEVTVEKTKYDITVKCNKPGYLEGIAYLNSGNEGSTLGNIILGGGIGWAVDSARGADNKYEEFVNVPLAAVESVVHERTLYQVPEPAFIPVTPTTPAPVIVPVTPR